MKIYTKTGDTGETSLFDGSRVRKSHALVDLYGDVDELNCALGLAMSFIKNEPLRQTLKTVQRDLFALGAKLANPGEKSQKAKADFNEAKITFLETQIDTMEAQLEPLKAFILPGGHPSAAALHLARCVCRRAERKLTALFDAHLIADIYLKYLNRLSDYLFVVARFANHLENQPDVPWL